MSMSVTWYSNESQMRCKLSITGPMTDLTKKLQYQESREFDNTKIILKVLIITWQYACLTSKALLYQTIAASSLGSSSPNLSRLWTDSDSLMWDLSKDQVLRSSSRYLGIDKVQKVLCPQMVKWQRDRATPQKRCKRNYKSIFHRLTYQKLEMPVPMSKDRDRQARKSLQLKAV